MRFELALIDWSVLAAVVEEYVGIVVGDDALLGPALELEVESCVECTETKTAVVDIVPCALVGTK